MHQVMLFQLLKVKADCRSGIQLVSYQANDVDVMHIVQKIANGLNIRSILPPICQD